MTLSTDGNTKNDQSFRLSFKGLFGKTFSKVKKHKKSESDLTFDAVPDFRKSEENIHGDAQSNGHHFDMNTNNTSEDATNIAGKNNLIVQNDVTEENSLPRGGERKYKTFDSNTKFGGASSIINHTSVVVNGGVGIHIGNTFNNVNNVHYNESKVTSESEAKNVGKVEKTEAIKALLMCDNKVEAGHLELLSSHFGDKWMDIGLTLGFTAGELQCIRSDEKKLQEKAFHMLMSWAQKTGDAATVGQLCKLLWEGNVDAAREAVKQLSLDIELLR